MSVFEELHPSVQEILLSGLKWDDLREVQSRTYAAVSKGCDVIVIAPTAGGKTESAFIPVIDYLLKNPQKVPSVRAIYLSPLKALINDQTDRVMRMCERAGLSVSVLHGDVAERDRRKFSKDGNDMPDVLLTTPESLEVLMSGRFAQDIFPEVSFLIVDEIHAFVPNARGVHLKCLAERLSEMSKTHVVRIGLSATVGNPEFLLNWMSPGKRKKQLVAVPSPPSKKRFSFIVEPELDDQIYEIVRFARGKKVLLFVESRNFAEKLIEPLSAELPFVYIHHSSISSEEREKAELSFEENAQTCVICTSTMELGIDIGNLDSVIQYGAPRSVASFLQRLGRTGRRGKPASMCFVLSDGCELLTSVAVIEAAMRKEIEPLVPPRCPYNVLVQQLFLFLKNKHGAGANEIVNRLKSLSAFEDVSPYAYSVILDYLLQSGYLVMNGDMYAVGERAERELGRSGWLPLISVIPDSKGYLAVLPDGTPIGTLDPRFVGNEAGKVFSFTGKTWRLIHRDDVHRRALVEPAKAGSNTKRPFWTGDGSAADTTPLVCRAVAKTIATGAVSLPLPKEQRDVLNYIISSLPDDFEPGKIHVRCEPEGSSGWSVVVSTFAGQRVNLVIARLIKHRLPHGHEIKYTRFAVRVMGFEKRSAGAEVARVLEELSCLGAADISKELASIPCDNVKFGGLVAPELFEEMTAYDYYDVEGVLMSLEG